MSDLRNYAAVLITRPDSPECQSLDNAGCRCFRQKPGKKLGKITMLWASQRTSCFALFAALAVSPRYDGRQDKVKSFDFFQVLFVHLFPRLFMTFQLLAFFPGLPQARDKCPSFPVANRWNRRCCFSNRSRSARSESKLRKYAAACSDWGSPGRD